MPSSSGYIKLYRKIRENALWLSKRKYSKFEAWLDLLLQASYTDQSIIFDRQIIKIGRGEIITTKTALARQWQWNWRTVDKFLSYLIACKQVQTKIHSNIQARIQRPCIHIFIINYNKYQGEDFKSAEGYAEINTSQSADNINNNKNIYKKINNNTAKNLKFINPDYLTLIEHYKKLKGYDSISNWDEIEFNRHIQPARKLLQYCQNLSEARQAMSKICYWALKNRLEWTMETVIKRYADLVTQKLKDPDGKVISYCPIPDKENIKIKNEIKKLTDKMSFS